MSVARDTLLDHYHILRGLNSRMCQVTERLRTMTAEVQLIPDDDLEELYDSARVSAEYCASSMDEAISHLFLELYPEKADESAD